MRFDLAEAEAKALGPCPDAKEDRWTCWEEACLHCAAQGLYCGEFAVVSGPPPDPFCRACGGEGYTPEVSSCLSCMSSGGLVDSVIGRQVSLHGDGCCSQPTRVIVGDMCRIETTGR